MLLFLSEKSNFCVILTQIFYWELYIYSICSHFCFIFFFSLGNFFMPCGAHSNGVPNISAGSEVWQSQELEFSSEWVGYSHNPFCDVFSFVACSETEINTGKVVSFLAGVKFQSSLLLPLVSKRQDPVLSGSSRLCLYRLFPFHLALCLSLSPLDHQDNNLFFFNGASEINLSVFLQRSGFRAL